MSTLRQLLERCTGSNGFGLWAVELESTSLLFTEYREMEGGVAQFHDVDQYGNDIYWEIPLDVEQSSDGLFNDEITIYKLVEVK